MKKTTPRRRRCIEELNMTREIAFLEAQAKEEEEQAHA